MGKQVARVTRSQDVHEYFLTQLVPTCAIKPFTLIKRYPLAVSRREQESRHLYMFRVFVYLAHKAVDSLGHGYRLSLVTSRRRAAGAGHLSICSLSPRDHDHLMSRLFSEGQNESQSRGEEHKFHCWSNSHPLA